MKRLLIMGAPGAGKGTQASLIKNEFKIAHISTGDMFREAISNKTPVGLEAKSYIDNGQLVPDSITIRLVEERLKKDDCKVGFLLDGFPRTVNQAEALDEMLKENGIKLDGVINIKTDDLVLIDRIVGRRTCPICKEGYHITAKKPQVEGICDVCGATLTQRADDNVETVTNRLNVYHSQTAPVLDHYSKQGLVFDVDGMKDISEVFEEVKAKLGEN